MTTTLYKTVSSHVNTACRFHDGTPPERNFTLRAILAAFMLDANGFGIANVTMAATAMAVSRPAVSDAQILLHSDDAALLKAVLEGKETLAHAADKVRARVEFVEALKNATDDDLAAFGRSVGPGLLFDRVVCAAL